MSARAQGTNCTASLALVVASITSLADGRAVRVLEAADRARLAFHKTAVTGISSGLIARGTSFAAPHARFVLIIAARAPTTLDLSIVAGSKAAWCARKTEPTSFPFEIKTARAQCTHCAGRLVLVVASTTSTAALRAARILEAASRARETEPCSFL